ncbi:hypothetical protein PanWU01x14_169090, partial [Parasponia andersonii]
STFKPITVNPSLSERWRVLDFILHDSKYWNIDFLKQIFWNVDVEMIQNFPLCVQNLKDSLLWHFDKKGQYSICSSYKALMLFLRDISSSASNSIRKMVEKGFGG